MDKGLSVIIGAVIVILGIALLTFAGAVEGGGGVSNPKYKVTCNGNIEVDFAGVGDPDFNEGSSCNVKKCSSLNVLSIKPLFIGLGEEGNVRMIIDGVVADSENWKSSVGENEDFTLTSSCVPLPNKVVIEIYNDDGERTAQEEVRL